MEFVPAPEPAQALQFLADRLRGGMPPPGLLSVVGRCRVDYQGRAASKLDHGDRIVLIKRDGALLIHGPDGIKPINWQPPGCRFDLEVRDGGLVLWARRAKPVEVVEVRFNNIHYLCLDRIEDDAPLHVTGSEFDLRDLLRARPELVEPGFRPWERERMTDQGPMDLYGEDQQGRRVVIEVKRVNAGLAEATQLWRYVEAERKRRAIPVRGILIAPRISVRALDLLREHDLEFVQRHWDDSASQRARAQTAPKQQGLQAFSESPPAP